MFEESQINSDNKLMQIYMPGQLEWMDMQYAICNIQYAVRNMKYAICNRQYAICNMHRSEDHTSWKFGIPTSLQKDTQHPIPIKFIL